MRQLPSFNPLHEQTVEDIHYFLLNLANSTSREVCFYQDEIGKYFSPLRVCENVSLCLDDHKYYEHYHILKYDIFLAKKVYTELYGAFDYNLLDHFEERFYTEENPVVRSFILLCLHNLSNDADGNFCDFQEENIPKIFDTIQNLESYFIKNTKLYNKSIPKNAFVVSTKEWNHGNEGILLSKNKIERFPIMQTIDGLNIYYVEEDSEDDDGKS